MTPTDGDQHRRKNRTHYYNDVIVIEITQSSVNARRRKSRRRKEEERIRCFSLYSHTITLTQSNKTEERVRGERKRRT
jgi:hypothetical protein